MQYIEGYKQLVVWQKSMDLVTEIYKISGKFPKSEIFGLTSQMRRAAVSVPSNIAEGSRRLKNERVHFLRIAFGSASELETQLLICFRLGFVTETEIRNSQAILIELLKMLNKMIEYR
jgi:four helix bundle protein